MEKKLKSTKFLNKFSNILMYNGKKKLIFKKVFKSLQTFNEDKMKKKYALKNVCIITAMLYKIKPILETRKIRRGSKYYDVPMFLKKSRSVSLLLRWVVKSLRKQKLSVDNNIKNEVKEILKGTGNTVKESKILRNKVSDNIKYSHYRWR